jgi:ParB family transcriptional regulator, chromosome partitioning protein
LAEKDTAVSTEKIAKKSARQRKPAAVQEARASPKTIDEKAQEILEKAKAEQKPEWEVAEQVVLIPLAQLKPFENHPFKVRDDDELMQDTIDSIMAGGVINPILVRPMEDGKFEVVSGHRRFRASELAGKADIKAIVREMDDDTAVITMVDSNLQRENVSPMEKAQAYRMKLEAMRRKAGRPTKSAELQATENCDQVGHNFSNKRSVEILADQAGESKTQVQRYIRLTELRPELQQMVDEGTISLTPAVELSYLSHDEQKDFLEAMDYSQNTPSLSQAQRLKKLSREGKCSLEAMCEIMDEEKKSELDRITIKGDVLRKYFPKSYTPLQMQETIIKLLEAWQKKRTRQNER